MPLHSAKPEIIAEILDIVAQNSSRSLTNFRLVFNIMPTLPIELIEKIIDIVALCSPESLAYCALVSRNWSPRSKHHFNRIFRTPMISTFDDLHDFLNTIQKHRHLAPLATSLEVLPVAERNPLHASYVPFHHLASQILPNVRHLILGETLRWNDYPLLYRNSTVGFFFHSVISLDVSCHFGSISDLLHAVQSFRNVQHVRLIYPHHNPPQWMMSSNTTPLPLRLGSLSRERFRLQDLELPLTLVAPILGIIGDSIVNLSVTCPEMSAVSADKPERKRLMDPSYSWPLLQTMKVTMPMETRSDDLEHDGGLGQLYLLLALITKSDVRCSLFLIRCRMHDEVGYRVEDVTVPELREIVLALGGYDMEPLKDCQECRNEDAALQQLELGHREHPTSPTRRDAEPRRFQCPHPGCNLTFSRANNLRVHVDDVHLRKRSHVCGVPGCPRAFSRKYDLLRHQQSAHTDLGSPRNLGNDRSNKIVQVPSAVKKDEYEA